VAKPTPAIINRGLLIKIIITIIFNIIFIIKEKRTDLLTILGFSFASKIIEYNPIKGVVKISKERTYIEYVAKM
jgi:hypothetical protein